MGIILSLCLVFFLFPQASRQSLAAVRFFLGDTVGVYYLVIGLTVFLASLVMAFSPYGSIILGGRREKPRYSFCAWGCMMFSCGLAADILFYSLAEWVMYAQDPHMAELGTVEDWAGVFPLLHWSFIPWSFYLTLAVAFGFMLHVKKSTRQRFSEACRPLLGPLTDRWGGRLIDLLAVFALIAGTATTFSVATPLMALIVNTLSGLPLNRTHVTAVILLITCAVYSYSLLHGIKGIDILARVCLWVFAGLLLYVFLCGGQTGYILEQGLASFGRMLRHFFALASYTDPERTTRFPQNWTIYYWAYWMVWCVAAPFFIGKISKGRSVRSVILGGYLFGVGATLSSFVVLGNYSMGLHFSGVMDVLASYTAHADPYAFVVGILQTLPQPELVMLIVLVSMMLFYATSFDSIAFIASCYSYRQLHSHEQPARSVQMLWCIVLILLPVALTFLESTLYPLQSVSIIAAFPIGLVMLLILASFFKDAAASLRR